MFCELSYFADLQWPDPNLHAPKRPSYYHASVIIIIIIIIIINIIMFQLQICYHDHLNISQKTKTNISFRSQTWLDPLKHAGSRVSFYPISIMPKVSTEVSGILQLNENAKTNNIIVSYHYSHPEMLKRNIHTLRC